MKGLVKNVKWGQVVLKPLIAIVSAVVLSMLLLLAFGYNPIEGIASMYNATFGNFRVFCTMLNRACPLIFTGLAVAVAYRGSVFNIGADGQFMLGAVFATWIGVNFSALPGYLLIPLLVLGGAVGGAVWAFIPGFLKARYGISEVITTIMFNYIALNLIGFLARGPMRDTTQAEPQTFRVAPQGEMPYLFANTRLHPGFIVSVIMAVLMFIFLFKSYYGYEVRAVGFNNSASRYAGINVSGTMIGTMLLSGALAGLGGAFEVSGATHFLNESVSNGYGYTAIAVSVLAGNNPLGVILSALLFAFLITGSTAMQRNIGVSASFADIVQGIIIIFIAVAAIQSVKNRKHAAALKREVK